MVTLCSERFVIVTVTGPPVFPTTTFWKFKEAGVTEIALGIPARGTCIVTLGSGTVNVIVPEEEPAGVGV
jgi:hypothetical protein